MGTSTSFGGGKNFNPLIPNWLDPDSTEETIAVQNNILADQPELSQVTSENIESNFQPNELQVDNRYSTARRNFTAFINSGGSDRAALGRAIASYVHKTSGGAKQAAKRMKSERQASVRLSNILSMASTNGIQSVIKKPKFRKSCQSTHHRNLCCINRYNLPNGWRSGRCYCS